MTFVSLILGIESVLPIPSVHSHIMVRSVLLEICCNNCYNIGHLGHIICLGNAKGKYSIPPRLHTFFISI